ncbi:MAG: zinc ribbon domain-containing protein [Myxococcota bacterium]|nr:zinc ribbon domain-containing protein [Myxococcota bacterium]
MPTYDYGCEACGAQWELEQRISEDPIKKCPKCKKMKARRMISGGNFILKGSGWYADLYHKPKAGSSKKSESKDSASSSSDSSSKSSSSKKAANE